MLFQKADDNFPSALRSNFRSSKNIMAYQTLIYDFVNIINWTNSKELHLKIAFEIIRHLRKGRGTTVQIRIAFRCAWTRFCRCLFRIHMSPLLNLRSYLTLWITVPVSPLLATAIWAKARVLAVTIVGSIYLSHFKKWSCRGLDFLLQIRKPLPRCRWISHRAFMHALELFLSITIKSLFEIRIFSWIKSVLYFVSWT